MYVLSDVIPNHVTVNGVFLYVHMCRHLCVPGQSIHWEATSVLVFEYWREGVQGRDSLFHRRCVDCVMCTSSCVELVLICRTVS